MKSESNSGCLPIILVGSVLLMVGWVCSYLDEQTSRMSSLANTLIGVIIIGVFILGYYTRK
jgi:uncharacterized membrane protein YeaQ/YmgE (transglycosylase-associated protein family)